MFRRLWEKVKRLWQLAKSERATPREIFWAVAIGVFAGCSPALGFHGPMALVMATLFKKNRLFAWLGSRVSAWFILPFIVIAEVQLAHRLRTGETVGFDRDHALEQARGLLLDWVLGWIPVGVAGGLFIGTIAWYFARRRDLRRARLPDAGDPA